METEFYCFIPVKSGKNLTPLKGFCPTVFGSDVSEVILEASLYKGDLKRLLNKSVKIAVCPFRAGTVMFSDLVCVL